MVRLLSTRKRFNCLKPIDDAKTALNKRLKEKRAQLLKQSIKKLRKIPDAECCLRQAVLIRNTYQNVRQLSNEQICQQIEKERSEKENIIMQSLCENEETKDLESDLTELFDFQDNQQSECGKLASNNHNSSASDTNADTNGTNADTSSTINVVDS